MSFNLDKLEKEYIEELKNRTGKSEEDIIKMAIQNLRDKLYSKNSEQPAQVPYPQFVPYPVPYQPPSPPPYNPWEITWTHNTTTATGGVPINTDWIYTGITLNSKHYETYTGLLNNGNSDVNLVTDLKFESSTVSE